MIIIISFQCWRRISLLFDSSITSEGEKKSPTSSLGNTHNWKGETGKSIHLFVLLFVHTSFSLWGKRTKRGFFFFRRKLIHSFLYCFPPAMSCLGIKRSLGKEVTIKFLDFWWSASDISLMSLSYPLLYQCLRFWKRGRERNDSKKENNSFWG